MPKAKKTSTELANSVVPRRMRLSKPRTLPPAARPYMFKPGQSGNPAGRKVGDKGTKPLTHAYKEMLSQPCHLDPLAVRHAVEGDCACGKAHTAKTSEWIVAPRTWAVVIAEGQGQAAVKGNTFAAKEIADRTEGQTLKGVLNVNMGGGVQSLSREDLTQLVLTGRLPGGLLLEGDLQQEEAQ
jgi:hypothetical protein